MSSSKNVVLMYIWVMGCAYGTAVAYFHQICAAYPIMAIVCTVGFTAVTLLSTILLLRSLKKAEHQKNTQAFLDFYNIDESKLCLAFPYGSKSPLRKMLYTSLIVERRDSMIVPVSSEVNSAGPRTLKTLYRTVWNGSREDLPTRPVYSPSANWWAGLLDGYYPSRVKDMETRVGDYSFKNEVTGEPCSRLTIRYMTPRETKEIWIPIRDQLVKNFIKQPPSCERHSS